MQEPSNPRKPGSQKEQAPERPAQGRQQATARALDSIEQRDVRTPRGALRPLSERVDAQPEADRDGDGASGDATSDPTDESPTRERSDRSQLRARPESADERESTADEADSSEKRTHVTVEIGRVELRAKPRQAPAPSREPAAAQSGPRTSLSDYLSRRNGGDR